MDLFDRTTRAFLVRAIRHGFGPLLALLAAITPTGPARAYSFKELFNAVVAEGGIETTSGVAYGGHKRHRLDVYRAPPPRERRPVVVVYYGGGWKEGERASYAFVGAALASRGYTTVIPDYRLYPEVQFPLFMDDAAAAYRWAHDNLAAGCGDTRPVIVVGHSAGAYMAAMIALDRTTAGTGGARLPQPAALIGLAGPYSFDPTTWPTTKAIFATAAATPDLARPVAFARRGAPPALILHGRADDTVKRYNSADLAAALKARGNVAVLTEYDGIGHVGLLTAIARPFRWRAPVLADMLAFIEQHGGTSLVSGTCAPARTRAP